MKLNKIIGLSVAICGVALSFAGATALYVKGATNAGFGIGAGTWGGSDGTITYLINDASSGTVTPEYLVTNPTKDSVVGTGLGGDYTQVHYTFNLGASFTDGMPNQNFVVGNFDVELTNINSALINASKIYIGINGYVSGSLGETTYKNAFMAFDSAGDDITGATYSNAHDIAVSSTKAQKIDVYFKLNAGISDETLLALNEGKAFDISVTWKAPTNFKYAYVVGNGNMWTKDEKYYMAPNINRKETGFEWVYNNLSGNLGEGKCKKESSPDDIWSKGDNTPLDSAKTYDVFWSGEGSDNASFNALA